MVVQRSVVHISPALNTVHLNKSGQCQIKFNFALTLVIISASDCLCLLGMVLT